MKLRISLDLGASLVKALYQVHGHLGVVTMEPQILRLPIDSIHAYKNGISTGGATLPEDDSWLTLKRRSDDCYIFGHLAKQFHANSKLEQLKYEQATPKLMAIIGAIIQREGLDSEVEAYISVLLPYGEFVNREQFQSQFKSDARNYYYRNQKINVDVETFTCIPEGGGFISNLVRTEGDEWFAKRKVVVLMCGHRNTSLIVFDRGTLSSNESQTNDLGFIRLVESVIDRTTLSQSDTELITKKIYAIGQNISADNDQLRLLVRSLRAENFDQEAEHIASVLATAREEYCALLQDWLETAIPKELDELIIAGGASHYLKKELDKYLSWAEPSWDVGSSQAGELSKLLSNTPDKNSLIVRFKDVFSLHSGLYKKAVNQEKQSC